MSLVISRGFGVDQCQPPARVIKVTNIRVKLRPKLLIKATIRKCPAATKQ